MLLVRVDKTIIYKQANNFLIGVLIKSFESIHESEIQFSFLKLRVDVEVNGKDRKDLNRIEHYDNLNEYQNRSRFSRKGNNGNKGRRNESCNSSTCSMKSSLNFTLFV